MLLLLPPEIAVRVLCFLELPDLMRMQQVHSRLREYIQSFHKLQYRIATLSAYVEDNPKSALPMSERLKLLKEREQGWARCNIDFRCVISVEHKPSGIYDLTGGIYLSGDRDGHTLHYVQLPSKVDDSIEWKSIDVEKPVIDIGLSVLEHDLLAAITSSAHPTEAHKYVHEVQLLQLSTGKAHPRAQIPALFLANSREKRPTVVAIEIVGVHLVLIAKHNTGTPFSLKRDHIYMFDWTSGEIKLKFGARRDTYAGIVFLTPELVLLSKMRVFVFEIWAIPSESSSASALSLPAAESERENLPTPLVSLGLPELSISYYNSEFSCRAEPNPTASTPAYARNLNPFYAAPQEALIICNISLSPFHGDITETSQWIMFVRRADMLAAVTHWAGAMEMEMGTSRRWTPDGSLQDDKVAYERWGPDITRWLLTRRRPGSWITTSAGTRCVHALPIPHGPARIRVLDFNPFTVRRSCDVQDKRAVAGLPFLQPLSGRLGHTHVPFVLEREWKEDRTAWDFDALLMDEERLVGLKTVPYSDIPREIVVMHIGEEARVDAPV